MSERQKYLTKFSQLTLATGKEPEVFMQERIEWPISKIFLEIKRIASKHDLPCVSRKTVEIWYWRIKDALESLKKTKNKKL
jgi:hypothetical protein